MVQWFHLGAYISQGGGISTLVLKANLMYSRGAIRMHGEKTRCATSYEEGVSDPETKVGLLDLRHIMVQSILG